MRLISPLSVSLLLIIIFFSIPNYLVAGKSDPKAKDTFSKYEKKRAPKRKLRSFEREDDDSRDSDDSEETLIVDDDEDLQKVVKKAKRNSQLLPKDDACESDEIEFGLTSEDAFDKKFLALKAFPKVFKVVEALSTAKLRSGFSSDARMQQQRLDTIMALPWVSKGRDNSNLRKAMLILNKQHYGIAKVKNRIIEHLAVQKRKNTHMGTIICLVGPPGVGKTTLAASIAKAAGRTFVKVACGGVHDESAIRGYPPSYQAASSGKIVKAMIEAEVINPVILLDEIDKLGDDRHNGCPADALLEVLDPSQNTEFQDHFIGVPYDLSHVMFIASANSLDSVPAPLLDRMEVIHLSSYTASEKFQIAKRHLIPRVFKETGIHPGELSFADQALTRLIHDYTCEAGVRQLGRLISKISRKIIKLNLTEAPHDFLIEVDDLIEFLDQPHVRRESPLEFDMVGHTQGLSVSASGGHMLPVEVKIIPGQGKIIRTGKMGDVMKESAEAAMTVVRDRLGDYGLTHKQIKHKDFHIHFYAAAIPKDGPSAGLAMATTLMSAITGRPVNRLVCMTGEISLHGKALPIGGLKEKLIAAHRAGMETALIPEANLVDLKDVPDEVKEELDIIAVEDIAEVLKIALT